MVPPLRTAGLANSPPHPLAPAGSRLRCAMSQPGGRRLVCRPLPPPLEPRSAETEETQYVHLPRHTKAGTIVVSIVWE